MYALSGRISNASSRVAPQDKAFYAPAPASTICVKHGQGFFILLLGENKWFMQQQSDGAGGLRPQADIFAYDFNYTV